LYNNAFSLYTVIITLSLILVAIILQKNPLTIFINTFKTLQKESKLLLQFIIMMLILLINKLEQILENHITVRDLTPIIKDFEGNIIYSLQNIWQNDSLISILTFFYIIVFEVMLISSFLFYLNTDKNLYSIFTYTIIFNYLLAIPFFLFIPISEVWYFDQNVHFLIPEVFSKFDELYRPFSGINNNFPSLHTSISVSIALIAIYGKNKLFAIFNIASTVIIIFSTFYLGIHWLTDMIGGVFLALISTTTAKKLNVYLLSKKQVEVLVKR